MAATNVQAFSGDITQGGQVLYAQKRWEIDLTSDTTTARFYPIYFASSSPAGGGGVMWPINFKVFGASLPGGDSFNDETLIGYARGGGYSDHPGFCKVHSRRFSGSEVRFQGIWEGTAAAYGFVIYMRGGYKYSILTDASTVVENKAAYTISGATFAVKDAAGSDVVGTSGHIGLLQDMNDLAGSDVTSTTGALYVPSYIYHVGDSNTYFGFSAADTIVMRTAGVDRLTIGATGTVTLGINMVIPDYIYHAGEANYDTYFGFSAADTIIMRTAGTNRLTVNSSGTVTLSQGLSTSVTPGTYLTGSAYNGATARTFAVDATTAATGSKIVARDASGHITGNFVLGTYMNMSHAASTRNSDTVFYSSDDNYIRKTTAAGMRSSLGLTNSATTTASASAGNSTLVQRHSSGYIYANYFNTTPNDVTSGVTQVCVETGNDGFIRHGTPAAIRTFIGATSADTASTVAMRDSAGDINVRLCRSDYQNETTCGAGIAFRNSTSDNYIRFCSTYSAVRARIQCYGSGSNITRTTHSNGFLVGSYNNVGANSAKSNPIYTIGSSYNPTDTSLSNMYGIGYSHGSFTSILTGGWGMYVADNGTARIGLNASSGNIKCTGYIEAGGNVTAYSDIRGKENIKRIENPLERIEKMNGYIYNKKEEPTKKYTGVVAQEVLEVLPEVVEGNEKDGYSVAYGNFAGIFIEAIKELKAQLQVEKSRNDRLEALMTTFNSRLDNVN